jgi:hypothetical protein
MKTERTGTDERRAKKLSQVRKRIQQRAGERVNKGARGRP